MLSVGHHYKIEATTYVTDAALDPYLKADTYNSEHLCLATCGYGQDPNNKNIYRPILRPSLRPNSKNDKDEEGLCDSNNTRMQVL